ncbi:hypothetical protein [Halobaculum sp. D14]|uniref:hypothetical protein n=1 Tax=unclassified Halobaculum TaxID=2640896 RepID=UPI003EBEDBAC
MKRRGLLKGVAGVAGLGVAAGCTNSAAPSGPKTPPRSPESTVVSGSGLVVADFTDVESDDGDLHVSVTVENRSGEQRTGTVVATASASGAEDSASEQVTVGASERVTVVLETSLSYAKFQQDGSLQVTIE